MYRLLFFLLLSCTGFRVLAQHQDSLNFGMNELVVSADRFEEKRKDLPRQVEIINRNKIQEHQQLNTADVLQSTGQVFVQKSQLGGGSPVIRGFEANRILLVLDGVRINNAIFRSGHLQNVLRIDPTSLEKIEVLSGPGSVIYGSDAMGGVLHFLTRTPKPGSSGNEGTMQLEYNSAASAFGAHANSMITGKKWGLFLSGSIQQYGDLRQGKERNSEIGTLGLRNNYQTRIDGKDVLQTNSDPSLQKLSAFSQRNLFGKFVYQSKPGLTHQISLLSSSTSDVPRYDRLTDTKAGLPVYAEWYYGPEKFTMINYQFLKQGHGLLYDEMRLSVAGQWTEESRITRRWNDSLKTWRTEQVTGWIAQADFRKKIGEHEMRYGVELNSNQVSSSAYNQNLVNGNRLFATTRYPDGGSTMSWQSVYVSLSHELHPRWVITEGLRLNHTTLESKFINKTGFGFLPDKTQQDHLALNGGVGIVYHPSKSWSLFAHAGNAFRSPNVDDLNKLFDSKAGKVAIVPNPSLKPEQSITLETGAQWISGNTFTAGANVYYTWLRDAFVLAPYSAGGSDSVVYDGRMTAMQAMKNGTSGFVSGLQLNLLWKANAHFITEANCTYTYGRIKSDSIMPLDHIPPVYGRLSVRYQNKGYMAMAWLMFNGEKALKDYYLNGEDNLEYATANGMPGWYTLNIQGSKQMMSNRLSVTLGVENLLDRNYRVFSSGISAPGRSIKVSVRARF